MKNTVNQETKQYYLTIEGQEVTVSKEVYNILFSLDREKKNLNRKEFRRHFINEGNGGYPKQKVVSKNGVSIEHYYPNDHGNPAHLHVKGRGLSTKIGPQGKPIKGQPKLSPRQADIVKENLTAIKKVIKQIQKNLRKSR